MVLQGEVFQEAGPADIDLCGDLGDVYFILEANTGNITLADYDFLFAGIFNFRGIVPQAHFSG